MFLREPRTSGLYSSDDALWQLSSSKRITHTHAVIVTGCFVFRKVVFFSHTFLLGCFVKLQETIRDGSLSYTDKWWCYFLLFLNFHSALINQNHLHPYENFNKPLFTALPQHLTLCVSLSLSLFLRPCWCCCFLSLTHHCRLSPGETFPENWTRDTKIRTIQIIGIFRLISECPEDGEIVQTHSHTQSC